ncbi:unnamed protein product [Triticum aestivum]|nr:hypothetical protein CFC21_031101 [Triticum aestivum]SPT19375.1 unnamed protein product [Triticum aestivum]
MPEPPRPCAVPRYKPPPAPHRNTRSQARQPPSAPDTLTRSVRSLDRMAAPATNLRRAELCAAAVSAADAASWWCAVALVALVLLGALSAETADEDGEGAAAAYFRGPRLGGAAARPCDGVYVVGEGETLHTISDKCGDPFIVERNPHVHDPDDVFPGLVLALRPTKNT